MVIVLRLLGIAQSANGLDHIVLRISLARIYHVVDRMHAAKMRRAGLAGFGGDPYIVPVRIAEEFAIPEVPAQQPKFPEMISNIFADVSYRAVGAYDHLGVFVRPCLRRII